MCGICGFAGLRDPADLLKRMLATIGHRGPDDEGAFYEGKVGLGIRRLSIIDVEGGAQPLFNETRDLALVFNGEIYNYKELRRGLVQRGHTFATQSDSETIVHLYEEAGSDCVRRLRGMYAFAIYDRRRERVFIARDRLGIKPLYYWNGGGQLLFASELKALLEHDALSRQPHLPAVDSYLSLRYVPGPETLIAGIRKLPASHWLSYDAAGLKLERYWEPTFSDGPYADEREYEERFAATWEEAVALHLQSDVPLGAFLSGGLDSTAIVAQMARISSRPVHTFSVGFDWEQDELPEARAVARHLGCEPSEVICRGDDMRLLGDVIWHLDEPVGDAIVIPMFLLARLARQHVKVVLTGEGADELMAGYLMHKAMYWGQRAAGLAPRWLWRLAVDGALAHTPAALINRAFAYPADLGERGKRRLIDFLSFIPDGKLAAQYWFLISLFDRWDKEALYAGPLRDTLGAAEALRPTADGPRGPLNRILALQYDHWLPDDILTKQDKMTMAHSIEGRVPFLDHVLVELLGQIPPRLKLAGWTEKRILRRYLARTTPGLPSGQRKKPFYIPIERFLATPPLSDFVGTCLSEASVKRRGYFEWRAVERLLGSLKSGEFMVGKQVFALLALELWHRIFIDREGGWRC